MAILPSAEDLTLAQVRDICLFGERDLLVVLGPTASGKTKCAVAIARALGGEIISADSRQVFRGMDIGTGKDLADYGEVPYHLIDIADPLEPFNVFRFQQAFLEAFRSIRSRGKFPILCGGTGLYINSVLSLYDFNSNTPLSGQRNLSLRDGFPEKPFVLGTLVDRETRNSRIDRRLDERLEVGMVGEIRGLLEKGIDPERLKAYGLEYRFVTMYVLGEISYEYMREHLSIAIHQFAKRQMTWFRGMERSGVEIHWISVEDFCKE